MQVFSRNTSSYQKTIGSRIMTKKIKFNSPFLLILLFFIMIRLIVIFNVGFIDDEAYHWSWTRHINISYYDHPGMVAWVIYPFTKIFGDVAWAVRLPGFLIYLGIIFLVYKLGKELFDKKTGLIASLLLFLIPLWGFASIGTMPDMPMGFFWMLIAWIFWQSVRNEESAWSVKKTWLWIGFIMGLGMNSKLLICMIGLGLGLYLLLTPRLRWHLKTPWPYLGALITFIMMLPVFIWNQQHDWLSFRYQFLNRHHEAHGADLGRWFQFLGIQISFMSPAIYFLMALAFIYGLKNLKDDRWRFMFAIPAPSLALFYYQPLMSAYKPHWSGPAYMILLLGAVQLFLKGWPGILKPKSKWIIGFSIIVFIPFQLLYIPLITPIIPKIHQVFSKNAEWNPQWDFSNEFYGWLELGTEVKKIRSDIAIRTGRTPELAGQRYELIAQLIWATKEDVWQLSKDWTEYWSEQTEQDRASLIGKDFLVVNTDKYADDPMTRAKFDSCEKNEWIYRRTGIFIQQIPARTFYIYYCKNFGGLN
jgi:dolichol-phosphate mannosyltransferase